MKKTLVYVLLLALLGGGLYLMFNKKEGFAEKDSNFTIKDTANIGKIYLAAMNGKTILLERTKDGSGWWTVNKNDRALVSTVNSLLGTFYQQVGKHPVPVSAHNSIVKALSTTGIKVEVYDLEDKKIREFYVGGETKNYDGSYMLMAGSETPFVVEIPGFPGYLTSRYSTEFLDWKDRSIFMYKKEDISKVSMQYLQEPLNSFVVYQDKAGKITADVDPAISVNNELNQRRVGLYFTFFDRVYCEGFTNGTEGIREILDTVQKRAVLDVTTTMGETSHLDIYWMPQNKRSKNKSTSASAYNIPDAYDPDRAYAVMNNSKDTMMIQYQAFDKIFRYAYEFYEKDQEPVKK